MTSQPSLPERLYSWFSQFYTDEEIESLIRSLENNRDSPQSDWDTLPTKTRHTLEYWGVTTTTILQLLTIAELERLRGIGPKGIGHLRVYAVMTGVGPREDSDDLIKLAKRLFDDIFSIPIGYLAALRPNDIELTEATLLLEKFKTLGDITSSLLYKHFDSATVNAIREKLLELGIRLPN